MSDESMADGLLVDYFKDWSETVKRPLVTRITFNKYVCAEKNLREIAPDLKISEVDKRAYQTILNKYGETHEKTTCMDFHHLLRACLLDALDDGVIDRDPSRKAVVRGKRSNKRKNMLSESELSKVIDVLGADASKVSEKWLLILVSRTGLRFAEALAVTPSDFDFDEMTLRVNKTWNYKADGGFMPTKNESSNRVIDIDWRTASEFEKLVSGIEPSEPVFISAGCSKFNSTYNDILARACRQADVPNVRVHGLRHTHASILLANGVSIATISQRLGHSDINTTQSVYLHITDELAAKDKKEIMAAMCSI